MNEEEIIKQLNELISWRGKHVEIRDYEIDAIQSLLELYNREKEKNKELTDMYILQRDFINLDVVNDYIPKNKIKEKIEELQPHSSFGYDVAFKSFAITILEELLEG